jgi:type II secretory pathway pseudopilin PulG
MKLNPSPSSDGFTLVEAVVAAALVATAAVVLAQLVALGATQSASNRHAFEALVAAQSKLEELRSTTWSHAIPGSDVALSPAGALFSDTPGYVDHRAMLARRWAVARLDPGDVNTLVITVCVFAINGRAAAPEACVSTIRTRQP